MKGKRGQRGIKGSASRWFSAADKGPGWLVRISWVSPIEVTQTPPPTHTHTQLTC